MAEQHQLAESETRSCRNLITKMIGIRWTLENFSKIRWGTEVSGPSFYLKPECIFHTTLSLNGKALFIHLCHELDAKIKIQRKIYFFDSNAMKLHEENDQKIFLLKTSKEEDLTGPVKRERFVNLPNDTLIIDLCINIKTVLANNLNQLKCDLDPEEKLREDLKMMLENPVNSDVSLIVGEERIPAHWSILCSRSSYFKKMFDSGECVQNSVTITDIPFGTLRKLLQFLYAADFIQEDDFGEWFDLYYAAGKFEVMDLRTLCAPKIVSMATTEYFTDILLLSLHYDDEYLKSEAIGLIRSHQDAVFQTVTWKYYERNDPDQAELIRFCLQKN